MGGFLLKSHRSAKLLDPNRFAKLREIEVLLSLYLPNIKSAWPIIFFCSICPLILGVKFSAQKCVKFISQFDLIFLAKKIAEKGDRSHFEPSAPAIFQAIFNPLPIDIYDCFLWTLDICETPNFLDRRNHNKKIVKF